MVSVSQQFFWYRSRSRSWSCTLWFRSWPKHCVLVWLTSLLLVWSSTAGCVKWTVYSNQQSLGPGRQPLPDYKSVSSCQNYCVQQNDCVAVEFQSSRSICTMHTNSYTLIPVNTQTGAHGVTQYRISRTCGQQASMPTASRPANLTTGRYRVLNTKLTWALPALITAGQPQTYE